DGPARYGIYLSIQRANNPRRQSLIQTERIADGECLLTNLQIARAPDLNGLQFGFGRLNPKNRNIFIWGRPDDAGVIWRVVIGQGDLARIGVLDDMIIRYNMPSIVPDKSGPGSFRNLFQVHGEIIPLPA